MIVTKYCSSERCHRVSKKNPSKWGLPKQVDQHQTECTDCKSLLLVKPKTRTYGERPHSEVSSKRKSTKEEPGNPNLGYF